jgi:chromosome partitioning protein
MRTTIPQDDGIAEAFEYRGEMLTIDEKYGTGAEVVRTLCKEAVDSIIMAYRSEAAA